MEKEQDSFSTRDVYLAAVLLTLGFDLTGVDFQIEGQRQLPVGYFKFNGTPELKQAEQEYWQSKLKIEPKMFIVNMRGLKSQISNVYKNPHQDLNSFKKE